MSLCLGALGWSPKDWWDADWRDIAIAIHGYREAQREQYMISWEQTRMISFYAVAGSANVKPGSFRKAADVFGLPWDDDYKSRGMSRRKHLHEIMEDDKLKKIWDKWERDSIDKKQKAITNT